MVVFARNVTVMMTVLPPLLGGKLNFAVPALKAFVMFPAFVNARYAPTFTALTGKSPFPWQRALYEEFAAGRFPPRANLPTGLGKTFVIAIWLIALANHGGKVPRRLVYVVNRRTVVDQATRETEKIRDNLPPCPELAARPPPEEPGPAAQPRAPALLVRAPPEEAPAVRAEARAEPAHRAIPSTS